MKDHESSSSRFAAHALSRRGFLGLSGATAAVVATGSAAGLAGMAPAAGAAIASRSYFSSVVGLELDGAQVGVVESAEGGEPAFRLASGASGQVSLTGPFIEPLILVLRAHPQAVYDWIMESMQSKTIRTRNLAVVCYDLEYGEWYRLQLEGARIAEAQFDAIDVARSDRVRLRITLVAERTRHQLATRSSIPSKSFKMLDFLQPNCRFVLDSSREFSAGVRVIEPIVVRAGADGAVSVGAIKLEVNPTALPVAYDWMAKALAGSFVEQTGSLQLLSRDLKRVLASVSLTGLGMLRVTAPVTPAAGTTPLAAVELYCRGARFNLAELG